MKYIGKIMLQSFYCIYLKFFKTSKKKFKIFKIEEIKKINSLIIPEHVSISVSSLSELLNLKFDINNSDNLNSNDNAENLGEINEEEEKEEEKKM